LFFQDEARIGQKGRVCHVWWTRGKRPPGLCDRRFTFAYIFAAVEPGTDNGFALVMPYADTAAMQEFLDQFSKTIAEDEHAVMILDQAGWHGSNALAVPANVTLVPRRPIITLSLSPQARLGELASQRGRIRKRMRLGESPLETSQRILQASLLPSGRRTG
jgi:hypothetical protein